MSTTTTIVIPDGNWNYLPTLVAAARIINGQIPLLETTAAIIRYAADKDNVARIFRVSDPLSTAEGETLLAEEKWEDGGAGRELHASLRNWYIKGTIGDKLEVAMIN